MFSLFQVYPEMQNLFPEFRGQGNIDKLEATTFLNGHAKRLMTAVENSVNSLNDFECCSTYLQELGRRHKIRKLKPHYLEVGFVIHGSFYEEFTIIFTVKNLILINFLTACWSCRIYLLNNI
jgi:hypothetical protein